MRISIIIPTYNRADLLVKTVRSAFAQTRPPDEIIVVDDGSTDHTRRVVAAYGQTVRYHFQENAHLGAARNAGQRLATGDALLFLDSDDLLMPLALERLEARLDSQANVVLAYCRSAYIDANDNAMAAPFEHPHCEGDVWERLVMGNFIRTAGTALIRRSALEAVGAWTTRERLRSNEDWEMWLRLADIGPFSFVDDALLAYRLHASMSSDEPAMYHWALVVLEMQIERHASAPERLTVLAAAYDSFYTGMASRWKEALRKDWHARDIRGVCRRVLYLLRLRERNGRNQRLLAGFRHS